MIHFQPSDLSSPSLFLFLTSNPKSFISRVSLPTRDVLRLLSCSMGNRYPPWGFVSWARVMHVRRRDTIHNRSVLVHNETDQDSRTSFSRGDSTNMFYPHEQRFVWILDHLRGDPNEFLVFEQIESLHWTLVSPCKFTTRAQDVFPVDLRCMQGFTACVSRLVNRILLLPKDKR